MQLTVYKYKLPEILGNLKPNTILRLTFINKSSYVVFHVGKIKRFS